MLNQVILVARLREKKELDKECTITVIIPNKDNTVNIDIIINKDMMYHINKYVNINDVLGIKGELQTIKGKTKVIAHKITFLTSSEE